MLAYKAAARLFLNDAVAIYVRCVSNFMLGSLGHRLRMKIPCPVFCVVPVSWLFEKSLFIIILLYITVHYLDYRRAIY